MDIYEAIKHRRSVRQYTGERIPDDIRKELDEYARECSEEGDLNIQILYDEPECFSSRMAHYGKFEKANNYIALAGKKADDLDERCGFYGEKLVLKAEQLGLGTCWVALTHGKSHAVISPGEKEVIIISLGFGKGSASPRKSKNIGGVSNADASSPVWFIRGVEAALLAPTAVNQQRFRFELIGERTVKATVPAVGPCLKIDLGIVKCHFEIAAGRENFDWADRS